jgi:hypothetical protein
MLSSLLRPKKARRRVEEHSPFSSPYAERRHATADFTEDDGEDENTEDEDDQEEDEGDDEEAIEEEDGDEDTPLLPIFSAAHLGISSQPCIEYLLISNRLSSCVQPYPRDSTHCPPTN